MNLLVSHSTCMLYHLHCELQWSTSSTVLLTFKMATNTLYLCWTLKSQEAVNSASNVSYVMIPDSIGVTPKGSLCVKVDNSFEYNIYACETILFIVIIKCCI